MSAEPANPVRRLRPCPICGAMAVAAHHPFCSQRCADVDLHRWLTGGYAIPATGEDDAETMPEEPEGLPN